MLLLVATFASASPAFCIADGTGKEELAACRRTGPRHVGPARLIRTARPRGLDRRTRQLLGRTRRPVRRDPRRRCHATDRCSPTPRPQCGRRPHRYRTGRDRIHLPRRGAGLGSHRGSRRRRIGICSPKRSPMPPRGSHALASCSKRYAMPRMPVEASPRRQRGT